MYNCSDYVLGYHDDDVTLPMAERTEMRGRRDANRERLRGGLKKAKKPNPIEFKSQGSYAMKTMTQDPAKAYDIDDGVYFEKTKLVGGRGAEMSALDARQMVRDALDDGSFKTKPEVRSKCVRVHYDVGYHVDVPVYRRVEERSLLGNVEEHFELASSDWKQSNARDVTDWFEKVNDEKSPDKDNGRQLRRVTRVIKKFAKSRPSWKGKLLSGFGITVLVTECFHADAAREDVAVYETMRAIKARLDWNLVVKHPVTPDETITNGIDDPRARLLREKLSDAMNDLKPLLAADCSRESAMKSWDAAFYTKYFSERLAREKAAAARTEAASKSMDGGILKASAATAAARSAVRKEGGGRYA